MLTWVVMLAFAALTGLVQGANASEQRKGGGETTIAKQISPDENAPLLLQADDLVYDNPSNRVIARGNVEIYYNNYTLLADEIIYDRRANTLTAAGNVRIKEPDGSLINADRITLTDNFRDGFIRSLRVVTQDDARIAASNAYRKDGDTTVFENGVFTPCKICENNPSAPPLWRIKAAQVIHDKAEQNIYYKNASFEFFGVPVLWVPYFYHPDPTVKRRSGFLMPDVGHSRRLGYQFGMPYYWSPSPSYDLTLTPTITTAAGILIETDWRQRLSNGAYSVQLAGVYYDDVDSLPSRDQEFRGSIRTKGDFSLGTYWNWGWDATVESDDTFRRFYQLDSIYATDRISQLYLVGQSERNYFSATMYHFGGLTRDDFDGADSVVHPVVDYNYVFDRPVAGGELSFDMNLISLSRDTNPGSALKPTKNTNRVTSEVRWRRTLTDPLGQRITPFFGARGDLYQFAEFEDLGSESGDDELLTRQLVTGGIDYRYPFVKTTARATHVIEPVGQVVFRPDVNNNRTVPNEDAQSLVFDDTLLFDIDKFSGYDRIETGTRANVGVQYTMESVDGVSLRLVGGQSFQLAGDNPFRRDTGLEGSRSDYVVGGYVDIRNYVRLVSQIRLNENDLSIQRQDVKLALNYGPFFGAVSYVNAEAQPDLGFATDREEVAAFAAVRLDDKWTLFGDLRYDIATDQRIRDSIGIQYSDECFTVSVTYAQTFIEDDDIKPDESVMLRIGLKYLGQEVGSSAIGPLSPEASIVK
jgi:LPS-assembly protein